MLESLYRMQFFRPALQNLTVFGRVSSPSHHITLPTSTSNCTALKELVLLLPPILVSLTPLDFWPRRRSNGCYPAYAVVAFAKWELQLPVVQPFPNVKNNPEVTHLNRLFS
jgi:hypothetical protein